MPSVLEAPIADVVTETELLVIWQQPSTRAMIPVGVLKFDGETYAFEYLLNVAHVAEFRPLLGFRDLTKRYESDELFPLFHERVMDPTRPDFVRVLDELSLDPASATPWEQLVRSGGSSEGDTLQVTPFPRESTEGWTCTALAAGVRYLAGSRLNEELAKAWDEGRKDGLYDGRAANVVLFADRENPYRKDTP